MLKSDDVRARLSRTLEVSSRDLDQCKNLYMLQGRPRWSATVVNARPKAVNAWDAHTPKHNILDSAIASVVNSVIDSTVVRLQQAVDSSRADGHHLEKLLQQLYTIYRVFDKREQGIKVLFDAHDVNELLRIGLGQLAEPLSDSKFPKVALDDYVSRRVVLRLGGEEHFNWSAVDLLAHQLKALHDKDAPSGGVGFEILCAAALCSFEGTVAELVATVAQGEPHATLPEWTAKSHLGSLAFDQVRDMEMLKQMVEKTCPNGGSIIAKPQNGMRPDLFGVLKGLPGPFALTASAKFWKQAISGVRAESDLNSTKLSKSFMKTDGTETRNDEQLNSWRELLQKIKFACGERALRIHFALTTGFAERQKAKGPGDGTEHTGNGMHRYKTVHVEGDEVRLIIDDSNYEALFKSDVLKALIKELKKVEQSDE